MAIRKAYRAQKPANELHYCRDCKLAGKPFSERLGGGFVLAWCPHQKYAIFLHRAIECDHFEKIDNAEDRL